MSQRSSRVQRSALQVSAFISLILAFTGCTTTGTSVSIHPSVGDQAKTLLHRATIDQVGLGSGDAFKRFFVGKDSHDLKRPVSIGMRDDVMYIFDGGDGDIFRYSLSNGRMSPVGINVALNGDVTDFYVAEDHSFYIADIEGRRVLHIGANGKLIRTYFDGPNISRPTAVAVDESNGEVFVADEVYSHIVVFSKEGEPLRGYGGRGEGPGKFRIITDMVKAGDAFYLTDRIELSVQALDSKGRYLTHFGEGELIFPNSLAVDQYGRVYVAEKNESIIKVFKQGKVIDVIGRNGYGSGEFRNVTDMKIHDGYLYAVDSLNGRIQVFEILEPIQDQTPETPKALEKTALLQ